MNFKTFNIVIILFIKRTIVLIKTKILFKRELMEQNLELLIKKVDTIRPEEMTPQVQDWLLKITDTKFNLVNTLIQLIIQNINTSTHSTNFFKTLKKLSDLVPQTVD